MDFLEPGHKFEGGMTDRAYRRGFDQATYFLLKYLGLTEEEVHEWRHKKRLADWRYSRKEIYKPVFTKPPTPTTEDIEEIRRHLLTGIAADSLTRRAK